MILINFIAQWPFDARSSLPLKENWFSIDCILISLVMGSLFEEVLYVNFQTIHNILIDADAHQVEPLSAHLTLLSQGNLAGRENHILSDDFKVKISNIGL